MRAAWGALILLGAVAGGCSDDAVGEGTLRISAYGESYIEDHIPAQDTIDGWRIEFSSFFVAFEDLSADGTPVGDSYIVDLVGQTDGAGHVLLEQAHPGGALNEVGYRIAAASSDAASNMSDEDIEAMVTGGTSIWVRGEATRGDETKSFDWMFTTDTLYAPCASEQSVPEGGTATSQITVHADHLFYDDLDSEEPNVAFDLIAAADTDADGRVTASELGATDIRSQQRYQVGGRDIDELWSFIEAQTRTLGHIDGEGHCDLGT